MNHSNMASKQYVDLQCTSSPYDCPLGSLTFCPPRTPKRLKKFTYVDLGGLDNHEMATSEQMCHMVLHWVGHGSLWPYGINKGVQKVCNGWAIDTKFSGIACAPRPSSLWGFNKPLLGYFCNPCKK
jgi:hypothetical protein